MPPLLFAAALGQSSAPAPDLATFEAILAAHDSATAALAEWCHTRQIADPAHIRAQLIKDDDATPPENLRDQLALPDAELPGYRHVKLACGDVVLSEAHNWYVASRLTPAMNTLLATSDIPFGKAAAALGFKREPLHTVSGRAAPCPAGTVSTHRALLRLPDGKPLALVIECYTAAVLAR